jgi:multidrug resistance efflux pump
MTYTSKVSAWLASLALVVAIPAAAFAAAPEAADVSGGAKPAAAAGPASAIPAPAAQSPRPVPAYPSTAPAGQPYSTTPLYVAPVPPLPPVPANPRLAELTIKYGDLDREILGLLEKARKTQDTQEKSSVRKRIQELVSRQFDLRQEARELEVGRLRKQLAEVEQTIGRHKDLKEKVVERRVTDLLDENAELKWEPLAGSSTRAVYDTVFEERVLPDGTHTRTPRTVVRMVPDGPPVAAVPVLPAPQPAPTEASRVPSPPRSRSQGGDIDPFGVPSGVGPPGMPSAVLPGMPSGVGMLSPPAPQTQPLPPTVAQAKQDATAGWLVLLQAEKRLEVSKQELTRMEELAKHAAISASELEAKRAAVALDTIALERARQEYEARTKILELDLLEAQVEVKAAEERVAGVDAKDPHQRQAMSELDKAKLRLERAKLLLDLQRRGSAGERPHLTPTQVKP